MSDAFRQRLHASLGGALALERELGGGGMSRVFVARDEVLGRDVVVKVLAPELAEGLSAERFTREIRLAAALQEPHIVPVLTAGATADGLPWYTMPFVDGESLRARLQRGPVPLSEAVAILRNVAQALAYAHARGIVHRDIKPENVLLSSGTAVVTDFGIAKALSASKTQAPGGTLTQAGASLGTPAYMAPEQALGDDVDHRADLYAWGIMAYELLAGRHPFAGRTTAQQLIAAHIAETPSPLHDSVPAVPALLVALVTRCLAKPPEDRPPSAGALIEALDATVITSTADAAAPAVRRVRAEAHRRRLVAAGLVALALGAVGIATLASSRGPAPRAGAATDTVTTLAVLPFVNAGGDPKDDYFSEGMTVELAHALSRLPGLRLAGRTSSFAFQGTKTPAPEIGRALGVARLVEGTVRRAGDRLRVTAQLTSAADGTVLWNDSYERAAGDVFQVQDELTASIVAALTPALQGAPTVAAADRGTENPAAYDAYLNGRHFFARRDSVGLVRAVDYFRRATELDSSFARAHAGRAMAYLVLWDSWPDDTQLALARESARRALALDPTLSDAHLALGSITRELEGPMAADPHYRRAVALEPSNPTAHQWHSINLALMGRVEEAVAEAHRAAALDPLAPIIAAELAWALTYAGRARESIVPARRALELQPDNPAYVDRVADSFLLAGMPDSALHLLLRARRAAPDMVLVDPSLALAYAAVGRWAESDSLRLEIGRRRQALLPEDAAFLALLSGDTAQALDRLDREMAPSGSPRRFLGLACDPIFDPLKNDPRFIALAAREGIPLCPVRYPNLLPVRPR